MSSENLTSADNQQETCSYDLTAQWLCGFTDGEGCFSVSIHQNPRAPFGVQINPVFQISQHQDNVQVLEATRRFLGVGKVRSKGQGSSVAVYAVDRRKDLSGVIIPFFARHGLRVKRRDFDLFRQIVEAQERKDHLVRDGTLQLVDLAYSMNARGKQRKRSIEIVRLGILRDCTPSSTMLVDEDTVRPVWRHAELGRNDLATPHGSLL